MGRFVQSPFLFLCLLVFVLAGGISAALSEDPQFSMGALAALTVVVILSGGVWVIGPPLVTRGLAAYAVAGTAAASMLASTVELSGGRLGGPLHPNLWGNWCYGLAASSMFVPAKWLRGLLILANLAIISIAWSRSALLALIIFVLTILLIWFRRARRSHLKVAALLLLTVPLLALFSSGLGDRMETIAKSAFAFDDTRGRGFDSGFTGRVQIWQKAFVVVQDHWAIGVGPRLGPKFLDGWSVHNGYLQVLLEFGVMGMMALLTLLIGLTGSALRRAVRGDRLALTTSALAFAYYAVALFEARILNAGNPTSIIFWMLLLFPFRSVETRVDKLQRPGLMRTPCLK